MNLLELWNFEDRKFTKYEKFISRFREYFQRINKNG